jgi:hypothetical protein
VIISYSKNEMKSTGVYQVLNNQTNRMYRVITGARKQMKGLTFKYSEQ